MTSLAIDSAANPRVRRLKKLMASARARRAEGVFVAEGIHLAQAMLEAGQKPACVYYAREAVSRETRAILEACRDAPCFALSKAAFAAATGLEAGSEILFEAKLPEPARPAGPVDAVYLDGVQDPGNVGTILRTARAAGVRFVAVSPDTADVFSPKVLRAAMGAHFALAIALDVEPSELKALYGAKVFAAEAKGGVDLYEGDWAATPTVWVMGSEGAGVRDATLAFCEERRYIPIAPEVESLNVAAAAAVCLFEQRRRRTARGGL